MGSRNIEFFDTGFNSRHKTELIKSIYNCKDKDLINFLSKNLKKDNWNGNIFWDFIRKSLKYNKRNSNIKDYLKNIRDLSTDDRLILKARLMEIECTYDRISIVNLSGVGLFAFLLIYKEFLREILFKNNPFRYHVLMVTIYIIIILFLANRSIKTKRLQSKAKYFLTIIDNVEN